MAMGAQRPLKISFLSQWCHPEPGTGRVLPFAKWLVARGHSVQIVTGFPNYPAGRIYPGYRMGLLQRETLGGVEIIRVPLYPSRDGSGMRRVMTYGSFALSAALIGLPALDAADVTYVLNLPTTGLVGALQRGLRGTPFVFNIPDLWPESVLESGMIRNSAMRSVAREGIEWVNRTVYDAAGAITVISESLKRVLLGQGVPASKVHTIYNWVDEDLFHPAERDGALALELGLTDDRMNVVYAGSFGSFQMLSTLVTAAGMLNDSDGVRVVLIGTGPEEEEIKQMARGVRHLHVLPTRPQEEMSAINALSDVMVVHLRDLPFLTYTVPSKTQVGLACGRPLLVAAAGEAARIVEAARAGLTCRPEDPSAMVDAIRRFAAMDKREREEYGARGRRFYAGEMSLDVGAEKLFGLLQQVPRLA